MEASSFFFISFFDLFILSPFFFFFTCVSILFFFVFFCLIAFLFFFVFVKVLDIRTSQKVTRVTVSRDTDRPTKVFEFIKLTLRP